MPAFWAYAVGNTPAVKNEVFRSITINYWDRQISEHTDQWRHFLPEIILLNVRWYCGYSLSYRDLTEMMPGMQCWGRLHNDSPLGTSLCTQTRPPGSEPSATESSFYNTTLFCHPLSRTCWFYGSTQSCESFLSLPIFVISSSSLKLLIPSVTWSADWALGWSSSRSRLGSTTSLPVILDGWLDSNSPRMRWSNCNGICFR